MSSCYVDKSREFCGLGCHSERPAGAPRGHNYEESLRWYKLAGRKVRRRSNEVLEPNLQYRGLRDSSVAALLQNDISKHSELSVTLETT